MEHTKKQNGKCKFCKNQIGRTRPSGTQFVHKKFCNILCFRKFNRGKNHKRWNGGFKYDNGYRYLNISPANYKMEHRVIIEKKIGRKLNSNEIVHHVNEDKLDNRIENLMLMSRSEHMRLHRLSELKKDRTVFKRRFHGG